MTKLDPLSDLQKTDSGDSADHRHDRVLQALGPINNLVSFSRDPCLCLSPGRALPLHRINLHQHCVARWSTTSLSCQLPLMPKPLE